MSLQILRQTRKNANLNPVTTPKKELLTKHYISCDKMLVLVDLGTNKAKYYTCISIEDEKDLEMTNQ